MRQLEVLRYLARSQLFVVLPLQSLGRYLRGGDYMRVAVPSPADARRRVLGDDGMREVCGGNAKPPSHMLIRSCAAHATRSYGTQSPI